MANPWRLLINGPRATTHLHACALTIQPEAPMALNLDGEPVQARRFDIACVPARLRMHLPGHCPLLAPARLPLR